MTYVWIGFYLLNSLFCLAIRSRIHERTISLRFVGVILTVLRLLLGGWGVGGGGVKTLVEVTLNKEKNSSDFCPNYVQEFGLWIGTAFPGVCVSVTRPNLQT